MYRTIDDEFVDNRAPKSEANESTLSLNTNQEREVFTTSLLGKFLNEKKLKEIESITDRIKYKRHLIELSTKELKKEASKKSKKPQEPRKKLTKKLKKKLGMCKLDTAQTLNYSEYEKLNEAWLSYATSCLLTCIPKNAPSQEFELNEEMVLNCLKQLDYHGCKLKVSRSKTSSLVGLSGIVLKDTRNVFYMLAEDNEVKVVPKCGNLFEFELFEHCRLTLVGANMILKPEMRVTKHAKIKTKIDVI